MSVTNVNGQLAEAKGKQLPLAVCFKPMLGYFIGTQIVEEKRVFTRESQEIWESFIEASQALVNNDWTQSTSCDLYESDL